MIFVFPLEWVEYANRERGTRAEKKNENNSTHRDGKEGSFHFLDKNILHNPFLYIFLSVASFKFKYDFQKGKTIVNESSMYRNIFYWLVTP